MYRARNRLLPLFIALASLSVRTLLLAGRTCKAWDTAPHQQITKAALDSLPRQILTRLGTETKPLIELYCMYPDRYQEMSQFGFVRKSSGPQDVSEIAPYCVRPDGEVIHGASGDWETDAGSIVYLFERILTNLAGKRPGEAARFAGVPARGFRRSIARHDGRRRRQRSCGD